MDVSASEPDLATLPSPYEDTHSEDKPDSSSNTAHGSKIPTDYTSQPTSALTDTPLNRLAAAAKRNNHHYS